MSHHVSAHVRILQHQLTIRCLCPNKECYSSTKEITVLLFITLKADIRVSAMAFLDDNADQRNSCKHLMSECVFILIHVNSFDEFLMPLSEEVLIQMGQNTFTALCFCWC